MKGERRLLQKHIEMSESTEERDVAPSVNVDEDSIKKYFAVIYIESEKLIKMSAMMNCQ